jgi:hypothetical protein
MSAPGAALTIRRPIPAGRLLIVAAALVLAIAISLLSPGGPGAGRQRHPVALHQSGPAARVIEVTTER